MNSRRISITTKLRAVVWLLSVAMLGLAMPQDEPDIVWQAQAGPALAFSSDGQWLVAGNQLRQVADGTLIRTFTLPRVGNGINAVALSNDARYLAVAIQSYNLNLHLFDAPSGTLIVGRVSAHDNGTFALAFSPDGQLL